MCELCAVFLLTVLVIKVTSDLNTVRRTPSYNMLILRFTQKSEHNREIKYNANIAQRQSNHTRSSRIYGSHVYLGHWKHFSPISL